MLGICAESPASGACFVGRFWIVRDSLAEDKRNSQHNKVLHTTHYLAIVNNNISKTQQAKQNKEIKRG